MTLFSTPVVLPRGRCLALSPLLPPIVAPIALVLSCSLPFIISPLTSVHCPSSCFHSSAPLLMGLQEMATVSQMPVSLDPPGSHIAAKLIWCQSFRDGSGRELLRSLMFQLYFLCLAAGLRISGTSISPPLLDVAYPYSAPGFSPFYLPSLTKTSPCLQCDPPVLCPLQLISPSLSPSLSSFIYKWRMFFNHIFHPQWLTTLF